VPAPRIFAAVILLAVAAPAVAAPAVITGTVLGKDLRPLPGASVAVVDAGCETVSDAEGTFRLRCEASGPRRVRVFTGAGLASEQEVELGPDRLVHLNFLLAPPPAAAPAPPPPDGETRLPNPVLTTLGGQPVTLRALGVVMAVAGFLLGFLAMLVVGRGLGLAVEKRSLTPGEVGDLVFNPNRALGPDRVQPVAVVGARGASYSLSYGVEEIEAAFRAGKRGLVAASLIPPLLVAVAVVGFALALLVGQPLYLFVGMMIVPLGFLATPVIIVVKARKSAAQKRP
jgi:hypothetical protein